MKRCSLRTCLFSILSLRRSPQTTSSHNAPLSQPCKSGIHLLPLPFPMTFVETTSASVKVRHHTIPKVVKSVPPRGESKDSRRDGGDHWWALTLSPHFETPPLKFWGQNNWYQGDLWYWRSDEPAVAEFHNRILQKAHQRLQKVNQDKLKETKPYRGQPLQAELQQVELTCSGHRFKFFACIHWFNWHNMAI